MPYPDLLSCHLSCYVASPCVIWASAVPFYVTVALCNALLTHVILGYVVRCVCCRVLSDVDVPFQNRVLCNLMLCYLVLCYDTSCCLLSSYVIWCCLRLSHRILCHLMLGNVLSSYFIVSHVVSCYVALCCLASCDVTWWYPAGACPMLCYLNWC